MNKNPAYILASGFTNGFTKEFERQLNLLTDAPENFVFIAADFSGGNDMTDRFRDEYLKYFAAAGFEFSDVFTVDGRVGAEESREKIAGADIILISGGHPIKQMQNINGYGLPVPLQKSRALIIGVSAGAINMAARVVLPRRSFIPELSVYYGIGLVDINIDPHHDPSDERHVAEIKEASSLARIYGLFDDSFITVKDGLAEFYGDYIIYG